MTTSRVSFLFVAVAMISNLMGCASASTSSQTGSPYATTKMVEGVCSYKNGSAFVNVDEDTFMEVSRLCQLAKNLDSLASNPDCEELEARSNKANARLSRAKANLAVKEHTTKTKYDKVTSTADKAEEAWSENVEKIIAARKASDAHKKEAEAESEKAKIKADEIKAETLLANADWLDELAKQLLAESAVIKARAFVKMVNAETNRVEAASYMATAEARAKASGLE